jgi:2-keto-4-pentenoate hydratase/2-oxohepta-3-ene-1,7-dioic acid hydratase in catechol pathway
LTLKFVSIIHDGKEHAAILRDDNTVEIQCGAVNQSVTMADIISGAACAGTGTSLAIETIQLLPPIANPSAIFCVGLNYAEHEREAPVKGTDYPTIFLRLARNQIAQGQPMITSVLSDTLDWEGELVVIIGKAGRHIKAANAFDQIFGCSIYNEASVRGFQHHTSQFGMGKNFEGTGAFGPCLVTADEFGNPYDHSIETRIDGEVVQVAKIDDMLHRIEDVIEYISSATTLLPGDIICTGTPAGVGAARKPQRFLKPGETVSVSVTGIGTLKNQVMAEGAEMHQQSKQTVA